MSWGWRCFSYEGEHGEKPESFLSTEEGAHAKAEHAEEDEGKIDGF